MPEPLNSDNFDITNVKPDLTTCFTPQPIIVPEQEGGE